MLTQKTLLLAKIETTAGVDALPAAATDAILVAEPTFSIEPVVLERNNARNDFSQYASSIGRKLSKISFSLQAAPSNTVDIAPKWATLLEGCSFGKSTVTPVAKTIAATPTGAVRAVTTGIMTFTTTANHNMSVGDPVTIAGVTDTTFNGDFTILSTPTATTFTVQHPTLTTSATSGAGTATAPDGVAYKPITDSAKTLTLYLYLDGLLHKLTGAMGTVSGSGEAGNFLKMNFEFTGNWNDPTQVAMPTPTYEDIVPPQIENAAFTFNGDQSLVVQSFSFDMANSVVPRSDVNSSNGFKGVRITGRNPTGGFNPEAEPTHTFWTQLINSTQSPLSMQVGGVEGRRIYITAPKVQISNVAYGDRDGLRTYDLSMAFRRNAGNDEISFLFD